MGNVLKKSLFVTVFLSLAVVCVAQKKVRRIVPDEANPSRRELFVTAEESSIPFRIPAIATASNGDLVAVCDYRFSRADIGDVLNGRIDLLMRKSSDNGKSWGKPFILAEGRGETSPDAMNVAFGDPAIVGDRESGRMMVLSCAGNISYLEGTRNNHLAIARFYSDDNGDTWSEAVDISEAIYNLLDKSPFNPIESMFVTSGRIMQSRYIKAGGYYRLYCALLVRPAKGSWINFVLYSDNFGEDWSVLGGVDVAPIPHRADEAKIEELPNGDVLISSRLPNGRQFNIFKYDDVAGGSGKWAEMAFSGAKKRGVESKGNECNGELMLLPARRVSDKKEVYLLLQSVPFGPARTNVGIYYKALERESDYATSAKIAKAWEGGYQATSLGSAYSTMCWQRDNRLGFVFEEETHTSTSGGGYTIIYESLSLEQITDGKYEFSESLAKKMGL